MKNKPYLISIILILFVSTTFLLWYGNVIINEKAVVGYSIFRFLNSEDTIRDDNLSALSFQIENLEKNDITYDVLISINNQDLYSQKYKIKSRDSFTINPNKNMLEKISKKRSNEYSVLIKWDSDEKNKEILKKQFKLSDGTN